MFASTTISTYRMWMVDDNIGDRILMEEALERIDLPIDLTFHIDGMSAWKALEKAGPADWPHLIILDLNMPGLKGIDILKRIKNDENYRMIPVAVMTTSSLPSDLRDSYLNYANTVFTKPFGFEEHVELMKLITAYWFEGATLTEYAPGP